MQLINSKDCEIYLRNIWKYNTINYQERVYVVFLNNKGERIDHKMICKGRYAECPIDPRPIVHKALDLSSNYIVLAHNHPCGDPRPSKNDETSTELLISILAPLNILLVDHIILAHDSYYSFKDGGLITGLKNTA